jgi:hypothetical protein
LEELAVPTSPSNPERFTSVDEAVRGLSRRLGKEVDENFVRTFFVKDSAGTIDLPPKPRSDPQLVGQVAALIERVNESLRDVASVDKFLQDTFKVAAGRRLSSYELQLLEFAVKHQSELKFQFDYHSKTHGQENPRNGDKRVVLGGWHHSRNRPYTPEEAFSTFMHETAHAREVLYRIGTRQSATGTILSEVNANIYGASGDIQAGISEARQNYVADWRELSGYLPGFNTLKPVEQYRYLTILCKRDQAPELAFSWQADALKDAFPTLAAVIDGHHARISELATARLPWLDDVLSDTDPD